MLAAPFASASVEIAALEARRQPYTALIAGIALPGAGHWYAGHKRGAVVSFVAVTLLFGVGYLLADYRVFAFTNSLFGTMPVLSLIPIHILPEAGNFLETTIAWVIQPSSADPSWGRVLRLPIETEHIGLTLTGLAGYLNAILAADACWLVARDKLEAERGRSFPGRPGLSVLLAWLVPGLGHVREGQRTKGYIVGGAILLLWVAGLWFSGFCGVDRAQLYWWWAAQGGLGGPTLVATPLLGPLMIDHEIATMDLGVTLLSLAGLLNVVAMTDVYTLGERRALRARSEAATS